MKFQVWADTEKITLASSSGVVFLLAVHLSDLAVHSEVAKIDFRFRCFFRKYKLQITEDEDLQDSIARSMWETWEACQAFTKACNLSSCQAFGSKSWLETLAAHRLFHPANFRFVCVSV